LERRAGFKTARRESFIAPCIRFRTARAPGPFAGSGGKHFRLVTDLQTYLDQRSYACAPFLVVLIERKISSQMSLDRKENN